MARQTEPSSGAHRFSKVSGFPMSGRLDDEVVAEIRAEIPYGNIEDSQAIEVATKYSINPMTVINIAAGKSYRRPKACPPCHPLRIELNAVLAARERERAKVSAATRQTIGHAQSWQCVYCGKDISGRGRNHIDHKIPITRGGSSDTENLQLLCPSCNTAKKDRTHEEYLAVLTRSAEWYSMSVPEMIEERREEKKMWDCPCHHINGCPPGCPGCNLCGHEEGRPTKIYCPDGPCPSKDDDEACICEFGFEHECLSPSECQQACILSN